MGGMSGGLIPEGYGETLGILKNTPGFPTLNNDDFFVSAPEGVEAEPQMIENYDSGIRGLIRNIPDSQLRSGLEKYLEIINAQAYRSDGDVGGSNKGLGQYHQQTLTANPCFASLAENFYSEISKMSTEVTADHPLRGRPTLAEEAGSGRFANLEPGWLMEKALQATNGDANLAIEMIGLCGHDDVAQYGNSSNSFNYGSLISQEKPSLQLINQALDFEIENGEDFLRRMREHLPADMVHQREEHLAKLKEFKVGVNNGTIEVQQNPKRNIRCPQNNSAFYSAKALGSEVDLSEEQKRRIEVIQAPTKGRGHLPAKNYHFMGAAYMACKLVQQGVSPGTATLVQKTAAWAYRTIRINSKIREDLAVIDELDTMYEAFVEEFHHNHFEIEKTRRGDRRKRITPPTFDQWMYRQISAQRAQMAGMFKEESPSMLSLPEEIEVNEAYFDLIPILENFPHGLGRLPRQGLELQDIANWRVQYDAAKILDDLSIGGGSLLGQEIPHTNLGLIINFLNDPISRKVTLADLENDPNRTTPIKPRRSRGNPRNWPRDRYQRAHDKALTYLIDWEWTSNQHEVGADFGSSQCTRQDPEAKPDDQACLILGERPDVLCNLASLENGPSSPIGSKIGFLGEVSDHMTEKYLDPEIKSSSSGGTLKISGAF